MFLSNDSRNVSVIEIYYIFSIKCQWCLPEQKVKDIMGVGVGCQGMAIWLPEHKVYFIFGMCTLGYVLRDGQTFCSTDLNSYAFEDREGKLMQNLLHSKVQVWNRICRVGSWSKNFAHMMFINLKNIYQRLNVVIICS